MHTTLPSKPCAGIKGIRKHLAVLGDGSRDAADDCALWYYRRSYLICQQQDSHFYVQSWNPEKCRQFLNDNLARIGASNKYQVLDAVEVLWRSLTADVFAVRLPRDGLPAAARAGLGRILHHMNTVNKQDPIVVSGVEDLGDGITQDV